MSVAAIVPAYNEEQTIGVVVQALLSCPVIDEIIVVSDGSTDDTRKMVQDWIVEGGYLTSECREGWGHESRFRQHVV